MKRDKRKIIGGVGTLLVHLAVFFFLFLMYIHQPERKEEGGVSVLLGNTLLSQGMSDPYTLTDVDVMQEEVSVDEHVVEETEEQMITQLPEETVSIKVPEKSSKEKNQKKQTGRKKELKTQENVKTKEKTEAEKRVEAEKTAAEVAGKKIAGAFGKGSQMGNRGSVATGAGAQGNLAGNSSMGKSVGTGGYGTFDLYGRSLGEGGLPHPVYKVQDEGRVVVTIIVDPAGKVIGTSINKRTNTVNASLRKAAEDAARKARFSVTDGVNNQTGTITYYFKLK